jgi:multidrug efflux pump
VEDRVSRTQFQYTLEDPNADELNSFAPKMLEKLKQLPAAARRGQRPAGAGVARQAGLRPLHGLPSGHHPVGDRSDAVRCLRPAEVSTMFTQLNQYHVVLELNPSFQKNPLNLRDLYIRSGMATSAGATGLVSGDRRPSSFGPRGRASSSLASASGPSRRLRWRAPLRAMCSAPRRNRQRISERRTGAAERFHASGDDVGAHHINHQGQFPVITCLFNLAPNASLGEP